MEDSRYKERRREYEIKFQKMSLVPDSQTVHIAPSGHYRLEVNRYSNGPDSWMYCKGKVLRTSTNEVVAEIFRNLAGFHHGWATQDGREYLICGEDYQGYTIICLESGERSVTFPEEGYDGMGFCWASVHPSPDGKKLAVEGCVWAAPYDVAIYDFSDPMKSPLPLLAFFEHADVVGDWTSSGVIQICKYVYDPSDEDHDPKKVMITWPEGD